MEKLDEAIDEYLVKNILNKHDFTDVDRVWFSLPPRLGGLGLNIIAEVAPIFYNNSKEMTSRLAKQIVHQHEDIDIQVEIS